MATRQLKPEATPADVRRLSGFRWPTLHDLDLTYSLQATVGMLRRAGELWLDA